MVFDRDKINILSQAKKTFWFFCICFVSLFMVFNIASLFRFLAAKVNAFFSTPNQTFISPAPEVSAWQDQTTSSPVFPFTEKSNSLEVPQIGVLAPVVIGETTDIERLTNALDRGVVLYPGFATPGNGGKLIILGHSAPLGWPKIKYETVFSKLGDLQAGSEVVFNFNNRQYRYLVTRKIFLDRGGEIPENNRKDVQYLYLVTCWPPGRNLRRLAVEAVLVGG